MKNKWQLAAISFGLSFALLANKASAVVAEGVYLTETASTRDAYPYDVTEYRVFNNLPFGTDIVAFGVTHNMSGNAIGTFTDNLGWSGINISRSEWNAGTVLDRYCDATQGEGPSEVAVCGMFETGSGPASESNEDARLGSFEELFGTAEDYVNFYWFDGTSAEGQYIWSGMQMGDFFYYGLPNSEYAAFDKHANLLYKSYVGSTVPEPGSLALLALAALAGLTVTRRRRAR